MQHKASKVCRVPKTVPVPKKPEPVPPPEPLPEEPIKPPETQTTIKSSNILEEAAKDTIYKQLEILVVDEEEQEPQVTHSTVDVQSISSDQSVSYVALQQKHNDGKLNAPIITGLDNKKGGLAGDSI